MVGWVVGDPVGFQSERPRDEKGEARQKISTSSMAWYFLLGG